MLIILCSILNYQRLCIRGQTLLRKKTHQIKRWNSGVIIIYRLCLVCAAGSEQEQCNRQGPLPDLLPQTEHLSRLSSPHTGPTDGTVQLRARRMAIQLRTIGDEFNATLLHRAVRGQSQSRLGFNSSRLCCKMMCKYTRFSQTFTGTQPVSPIQPSS